MSAEAWLIDTPKRRTRSVRLTSPIQNSRSSTKARRRSTLHRSCTASAASALDSCAILVLDTIQFLRPSTFSMVDVLADSRVVAAGGEGRGQGARAAHARSCYTLTGKCARAATWGIRLGRKHSKTNCQ